MRLDINLNLEQAALRTEREEEIFEVERAITVARNLNIQTPTMPYQLDGEQRGSQIIYSNVGNLPKYFMGYETLESERDALISSLDKGLSNQQSIDARQQISDSISEDESSKNGLDDFIVTERVVDVIEYAFPGERTVSPNKPLILALSIVIGSIFGLVIALMSVSFKNMKRRDLQE